MRRLTLVSLVLSLLSLGGLAGCKSGLDERCQVTADCESGLVCVVLSSNPENPVSVCRESVTDMNDAAIDAPQDGSDLDAPAIDSTTPDSSVDAPIDAPIDAP